MAIAVETTFPGGTLDEYDGLLEQLGSIRRLIHKSRIDASTLTDAIVYQMMPGRVSCLKCNSSCRFVSLSGRHRNESGKSCCGTRL
jgi:hypothetical protein